MNRISIALVGRKISHWLWFVLILSLLPLIVSAWKINGIENQTIEKLIRIVISHGELLLVSTSVLGGCIGEILLNNTRHKTVKIWIGGGCIVLALFAISVFSEISACPDKYPMDYVFYTSRNIFIFSNIMAISSIILPKKDK